MEMLSATPPDFDFHSAASSPYATAPTSPQPFGQSHHFYNLSAPTSPTQSPPLNSFLREINRSRKSLSAIPFGWEASPGVPKHLGTSESTQDGLAVEDDFEFDFSGQLDVRASASAEELFDGGKIRPLKLPPRLQVGSGDSGSVSSSTSPRTPRSRFSPKNKFVQRKDFDPFAKALEETRKSEPPFQHREQQPIRGRDRNIGPSSSSSSSNYPRRGTRSLSPLRVSGIVFDEEANKVPYSSTPSTQATNAISRKPDSTSASYFSSLLSSISFSKGYRKWSFKDFLLFRSASEGRGTSRDPLRRYSALSRKTAIVAEDTKSCSFRSTDSAGSSVSSSRRRSRPNLSAHEIHYTTKRAASEEMRKKTFLPYKQGLLGCLGFNPGMNELARGFGSLTNRG